MMCQLPLALGLLLLVATAHAAQPGETWTEPETGMSFVWIPKGCFQMGTSEHVPPSGDTLWNHLNPDRNLAADEQPRHEVCVDGYWIGKHEVRIADWHRVMGGKAPAARAAKPIASVSWAQAGSFAERLTTVSASRARFRLPTEAEWEYACRTGTENEIVPRGADVVDRAWYNANEAREAKPRTVGQLAPNDFGLHDMLGNVWEWTADTYLANGYATHPLYNPHVEANGDNRVIRGGSHRSEPEHVRCARRGHYPTGENLGTIGFRLVRSE